MSSLHDSVSAQTLSAIVISIALLNNIAIFVNHSYFTFKAVKKSKLMLLSLLSMLTMIIFLVLFFFISFKSLSSSHSLPSLLNPPSYINCKWVIGIPVISWMIYKFSLYFLFSERLFSVFANGSDLCFKPAQIYFTRTVLLLWAFILIALSIYFCDGTKSKNIANHCMNTSPFWIYAVIVLSDICIVSVISILLSRRLLALHFQIMQSNLTNTKNENNMDSTLQIVRKSALLTFIALFSTEISLILTSAVGATGLWLALDCIVNAWCVMLIFSAYSKVYKIMCGCCKNCISMRCLACYSCHCLCPIQ